MPKTKLPHAPRRQLPGNAGPLLPDQAMAKWRPATLLGKLVINDARPIVKLSEILLLPLMALVLGFAWNPDDPLWSHSSFPWSWLAPVLLALRYGPLAGLGGACVLLAGWLAFSGGDYRNFPQLFFLGGLILVMLVGEFSSLWLARTRRAEVLQQYLDQRLEHLVRQHYLLRLSHDRLALELIGRPISMRDALATLQAVGADVRGPETLLKLLAQYCQLETAALFPVVQDQPGSAALAQLGDFGEVHPGDPLIQQAMETRRLCHISQAAEAEKVSRYLVAAPLLDLGGDVYGVLVVANMPFFSLQNENLQTINLLLGYFTDGLSMQTVAQPIVSALPQCPLSFAFETMRLTHVRQTTGLTSVVVTLEFVPRAVENMLPQQISQLKRELDELWLIEAPQRHVLAVLMPLGDESTARGYITRLETWAQQKSGHDLASAGVFPRILPLDTADPLSLLQGIERLAHD